MSFRRWVMFFAMLIILAIFVPYSPAHAVGQTIYTTTQDFDGGTKTARPLWFASNGVDQPTFSYITQPQAIYSSAFQRTYVAYFAHNLTLPTSAIYITYYDHQTALWTTPKWLFNVADNDGHRNPAVWVLSSGRILVIGGAHDDALKAVRTTTFDGSIDSWISLSDPTTVATYPTLFEYPLGTVWLFYRSTGGFTPFSYRKSTDDGSTWTSASVWVDMSPDGVYPGKWDIVGDRFYFPWVMWNSTTTLRNDEFVCYMDLDTGVGFSLGGTNLGTDITRAEAVASCRVVHQQTGNLNGFPSIDVLSNGNVYFVYPQGTSPFNPVNWMLRFIRYTGTWSSPVEIGSDPIGAELSHADVRMDTDATGELFMTTLRFGDDGSPGFQYTGNIERWTWNGVGWGFGEHILSQTKAGDTVNMPYVPWNYAEPVRLIFAMFYDVAQFASPMPYRILGDQKLYAWGSSGFVRPNLDDGLFGVQTSTDNAFVPSGAFRIAGPDSDLFTHDDADVDNWNWRFVETGQALPYQTAVCVRSVSTGSLILNWTGVAGAVDKECGARSAFYLDGDFDVRVKANLTDASEAGSANAGFCAADTPLVHGHLCGAYASTDGIAIRNNFNTAVVQTFRLTAGVGSQLGTNTGGTSNPIWLRIARTGTTWTSYFSSDGTSWTTDETDTFGISGGRVWFVFSTYFSSITSGTTAIRFDEWRIQSGVSKPEWYRSSAEWRTPARTFDGEVVNTIRITAANLSSIRYIDAVLIANANTNVVLYRDDTDHTSGTNILIDVPDETWFELHDDNWYVEIDLRSDGTGTPEIQQVEINTVRSPISVAIVDAPYIFGFFAMLTLGVLGALALARRRRR